MRGFFAPGGWLARSHPHYEFRAAQLEMAEMVEAAFREKRHLLVEAGTGTGKTLAYLLPALMSGRRVVISTGTKNLQEQLYLKDIPFLEQVIRARQPGREIHVCYMKGRNNYLCRKKLYEMTAQGELAGLGSIGELAHSAPGGAELRVIRQWEPRTETGDRAELADLPESSALWPLLDARRDTCTGQKCEQFERCFLTWMHQRAIESDLIIVNHHLFFADLALKQRETNAPGLGIIPDYQAVIFDEAHEIEDVAAQYFGVAASNYRVEELARDTDAVLRAKGVESPAPYQASRRVAQRTGALFDLLGESVAAGDGRHAFEERAEFLDRNVSAYAEALGALDALGSELAALREKPEEIHALARRAGELRRDLALLIEGAGRGDAPRYVHWIERRGRGIFLQATPIEVGSILEAALFDQVPTCVLTSATLAVAGQFDFVKRRLGVRYSRERALDSSFDYARQALLYIPPELPDPRRAGFVERAAEVVCRLLELTRGRAFVLFTSYQQMHQIWALAAARLKFPLLVQGSAPRTALLDRFRSLPNAVLFATSSFWQGVDVPGEQLSCVIIDRLPFAVPTDPVVAARLRQIREEGGEPFMEYQVPQAVIALKQGFGRLIRRRTDRGVLAILDTRILTKNYGTIFLESLPGYEVTRDLAEVARFMGSAALQGGMPG